MTTNKIHIMPIGIATHYGSPAACGQTGVIFWSDNKKHVDCLRCRQSKKFKGDVKTP